MFFPLENPGGAANFISDAHHKYELKPGKIYFVPAFLHALFNLDDQLLFLSIQASLELFPGVDLFSDCPRMLELPAPPEFEPLMEIFDYTNPQTHCQHALQAGTLIYSMLLRMMEHYDTQDFWKPLALRKYSTVTDFLQQNGNALMTVSDLAAEMKVSRENFTRHFIADTGITPKQLIDRFVIRRCLSLIQQGASFKEIALRMGFRDVFAFSRYFKRNIGISPGEWRTRRKI
jgi:AraC-like DNA-binding protein